MYYVFEISQKFQKFHICGAHGDYNPAPLCTCNNLELNAYLVIWNVTHAQVEKSYGCCGKQKSKFPDFCIVKSQPSGCISIIFYI